MVRNYMEDLIEEMIQDLLRQNPCPIQCKCEECLDNVRAIVLNKVKPFYVTGKKGEVFGTYRNKFLQNKVDLFSDLLRAVEIVNAHPNHT